MCFIYVILSSKLPINIIKKYIDEQFFLKILGKKQMGNNEALKTLWVYIKKHKLQGKLKNLET